MRRCIYSTLVDVPDGIAVGIGAWISAIGGVYGEDLFLMTSSVTTRRGPESAPHPIPICVYIAAAMAPGTT